MSKEQIEKIANVLYESDNKRNVVICGVETVAEDIYNAGYREKGEVFKHIKEYLEKEIANEHDFDRGMKIKGNRTRYFEGRESALKDMLVFVTAIEKDEHNVKKWLDSLRA